MCPTLPQLAIADFIKSGGYERHLRRMRLEYKQGRDSLLNALEHYFPEQTCISFPEGGYLLWVELPKSLDAVKLARLGQDAGVNIAAGPIFSATGKYRHCMRLNFSEQDAHCREEGIRKLAYLIKQQNDELHK